MEASKLIETLRFCGDPESCCAKCPSGNRVTEYSATECMCDLMQKAANAIEELESQLKSQKCNRDPESAIRLEEKQATSDGWIPVTERRPEKDVRVLVWVGENSCNFPVIDTDRIHCGRWVRWDERITHWMPLPEPPKEGTP